MKKQVLIIVVTFLFISNGLSGCIKEINEYKKDSDHDGFIDEVDEFPNDNEEWLDSDLDGIGNNADNDDDNDGYLDSNDYLPYQDAKLRFTINKFMVIDEVDTYPEDFSKAQVYFKIIINNSEIIRVPNGEDIYQVDLEELKTINWNYTYNLPDNVQSLMLSIHMYDSDAVDDDQLDIDGYDTSKSLSIIYYIISEKWIGDDGDGITDGSDDGTQFSDDDDAYLEYNLETI